MTRNASFTRWPDGLGCRAECVRLAFIAMLVCLALSGCRSTTVFAPLNFSEPGWKLHEGQVAWQSRRGAPEIIAEFHAGIHPDGRCWLEVSKAGLPFLTAQTDATGWQIHSVMENRRHAGRGAPPARVGWFQFVRCLAGQPPAANWTWERRETGTWRLANPSTGERMEGVLTR